MCDDCCMIDQYRVECDELRRLLLDAMPYVEYAWQIHGGFEAPALLERMREAIK